MGNEANLQGEPDHDRDVNRSGPPRKCSTVRPKRAGVVLGCKAIRFLDPVKEKGAPRFSDGGRLALLPGDEFLLLGQVWSHGNPTSRLRAGAGRAMSDGL